MQANHEQRTLSNSTGMLVPVAADSGGVAAEGLNRTDWVLIAFGLAFLVYAFWCVLFEPYEMSVTHSMREAPLVVKLVVVGVTLFLFGHWWW